MLSLKDPLYIQCIIISITIVIDIDDDDDDVPVDQKRLTSIFQ